MLRSWTISKFWQKSTINNLLYFYPIQQMRNSRSSSKMLELQKNFILNFTKNATSWHHTSPSTHSFSLILEWRFKAPCLPLAGFLAFLSFMSLRLVDPMAISLELRHKTCRSLAKLLFCYSPKDIAAFFSNWKHPKRDQRALYLPILSYVHYTGRNRCQMGLFWGTASIGYEDEGS